MSLSLEMKKYLLTCTVIVENFPSRVELYQKLDNFISENKYTKDYSTDNRDNIISFKFKNSDVGFEFVKYINLEKIKNTLYAKIRTNIVVDAKKEFIKKRSPSPKKEKNINTEVNNKNSKNINNENSIKNAEYNYNKNNQNKNIISKVDDVNLLKLDVKNNNNNIFNQVDYSHVLPRGKTLASSSPYTTESERHYKEYLQNKQKWLNVKGFEVNFGKLGIEKKSVIPNYVFVSPSKIPLFKYKFRDINKEKWINKKEFSVKNSNDLIW